MAGPIHLHVENLAIERGDFRLFEGVSFSADAGAHVALTGPNGSGKTSLLRAIAGFLKPAAGSISLQDRASSDAPPFARLKTRGPEDLHFLGHRDGLKSALDVRAHVKFWRDLLGGDGDIDAALTRVGLARVADLPARVLSAGQARRLALTWLIVAPRPVWLLDEPAAALDADGKALLTDIIAEHRSGGGIVVAAVHEALGEPSEVIRLGDPS